MNRALSELANTIGELSFRRDIPPTTAQAAVYVYLIILPRLSSGLSRRFWERTLHLDAMIRAKNQAQRSRTLGAGSALTALIGGA